MHSYAAEDLTARLTRVIRRQRISYVVNLGAGKKNKTRRHRCARVDLAPVKAVFKRRRVQPLVSK